MNEPQNANNRICTRCGDAFMCGVAAGDEECWCFHLPNVIPNSEISAGGEGCLCFACLRERLLHQSWHLLDIFDESESDGQWSN